MELHNATMTNPSITLIHQRRQDWFVIGLVGLGHAGSHFSHLLLPLMFPFFSEIFHLGYAELGTTVTVFFIVSGIGQAMSGFVVDRFGSFYVLLASLLLLICGCLVASVADGTATPHHGDATRFGVQLTVREPRWPPAPSFETDVLPILKSCLKLGEPRPDAI